MKKLLLPAILFLASCTKNPEAPQQKCNIITDKYISNGTPTFEFEQLSTLHVSQSVYDSHKIGDNYCY